MTHIDANRSLGRYKVRGRWYDFHLEYYYYENEDGTRDCTPTYMKAMRTGKTYWTYFMQAGDWPTFLIDDNGNTMGGYMEGGYWVTRDCTGLIKQDASLGLHQAAVLTREHPEDLIEDFGADYWALVNTLYSDGTDLVAARAIADEMYVYETAA